MTTPETSPADTTKPRPNDLQRRVDAAAEAVLGDVTFSDPTLRRIAETLQINTISTLKDEFTRNFLEMRSALAELPNTEAECNRYVDALTKLYCVEASLNLRRETRHH